MFSPTPVPEGVRPPTRIRLTLNALPCPARLVLGFLAT